MKNPFGDEAPSPPRRVNPFGEPEPDLGTLEAAERVEHAARKIRNLRTQLGAEGLTLAATRELIDETAAALEAISRAITLLHKE